MLCPCCEAARNSLKNDPSSDQFVKCVRNHKFEIKIKGLDRELVLVGGSDGKHSIGLAYSVPTNETFET